MKGMMKMQCQTRTVWECVRSLTCSLIPSSSRPIDSSVCRTSSASSFRTRCSPQPRHHNHITDTHHSADCEPPSSMLLHKSMPTWVPT
eukprot:2100020-Rhodomonas_salina.1